MEGRGRAAHALARLSHRSDLSLADTHEARPGSTGLHATDADLTLRTDTPKAAIRRVATDPGARTFR